VGEKHHDGTTLLGYFLFAAIGGIAASGIIGLVLTNFMIGRFEKADRPIKLSYKSKDKRGGWNQRSSLENKRHLIVVTEPDERLCFF